MIYIVPLKLNTEGFKLLSGDRRKVILELLGKDVNADTLLAVDDFLEQRSLLNYLGLNYKVVIGIPNVSADEQIMFETSIDHLIDFTDFIKIVKSETIQEREVKSFLTGDGHSVASRSGSLYESSTGKVDVKTSNESNKMEGENVSESTPTERGY